MKKNFEVVGGHFIDTVYATFDTHEDALRFAQDNWTEHVLGLMVYDTVADTVDETYYDTYGICWDLYRTDSGQHVWVHNYSDRAVIE